MAQVFRSSRGCTRRMGKKKRVRMRKGVGDANRKGSCPLGKAPRTRFLPTGKYEGALESRKSPKNRTNPGGHGNHGLHILLESESKERRRRQKRTERKEM